MMAMADLQMAFASHGVMPAKAGIQKKFKRDAWVPACAGTTFMKRISRCG